MLLLSSLYKEAVAVRIILLFYSHIIYFSELTLNGFNYTFIHCWISAFLLKNLFKPIFYSDNSTTPLSLLGSCKQLLFEVGTNRKLSQFTQFDQPNTKTLKHWRIWQPVKEN